MPRVSCTAKARIGFGLLFLLATACGGTNDSRAPVGPGWALICKNAGNGSAGAAGNGSDKGNNAVPKVANERIGDNVFDESAVQSYYLTISDEDYAKLMDFSTLLVNAYTVNEDRYVEAALRVGDMELPSIAVRIKGAYSVWGCVDFATGKRVQRVNPDYGNIDVCQRFSLKLDLDRCVDRLRLDGLKKVNLHAMAADPSKMRERLSYSLFRDMGIMAPRAVHARVYINGEYQGLFAAVEEVDGRFTANRFSGSGDGNLYRNLWPFASITAADAAKALRTNNDPGREDVSDFMSFKDALVASNEASFASQMAPYLDFDYLARYIVVDRAINNFDGIMAFFFGSGWGPFNQNYYWYDVGGGRFTLIPWDFDKAFWYPDPKFWSDNAPKGKCSVPNWNIVTNGCGGYVCPFDSERVENGVTTTGDVHLRQIDCDPFMRLLRGQIYGSQKAIADAFIAGPFSEEKVRAKVEAWRVQIADAMAEDPLVDSTQWQSSVDALLADLPQFQNNLSLTMSGLIVE